MNTTPKSVVQIVVIMLGVITVALIAGAFVLIALDHPVPDPVWTLAGVGVGAFGSLLASTRTGPEVAGVVAQSETERASAPSVLPAGAVVVDPHPET